MDLAPSLIFFLLFPLLQLFPNIFQTEAMPQNDENKGSSNFERMLNWNGEFPQAVDIFVQTLIQEQAARHPDSQAVCSWDGSLSYSELDDLSSHLANYLFAQGVGPETIVPLCFEKSVWTIVGLLGVLKAGGAFLLLDPSQPIARLQSIVSQTGAQFALSSTTCVDICKTLVGRVSVVHAGTFLELEKVECSPPDLANLRLSNAAYYIFTSGSTGTPKGVISTYCSILPPINALACSAGCGNSKNYHGFALTPLNKH